MILRLTQAIDFEVAKRPENPRMLFSPEKHVWMFPGLVESSYIREMLGNDYAYGFMRAFGILVEA